MVILLYLRFCFFISFVVCDNMTLKSPEIAAKIEYGKHYVTRTFSVSTLQTSPASTSAKRGVHVRVKRTRATNSLSSTSTSETNISTSTEPTKAFSRSIKYTTNWWRYTTNYKGASVPYPLMYLPEVLKVKHNITKWWDPRYTDWYTLFMGHTAFSRWRAFTLRMYPWKALNTRFKPALSGVEDKLIRNWPPEISSPNAPQKKKRKYWKCLMPLSPGPFRAYRPVYWYEQRNLSCPHPVVTNTPVPYTGPPMIEFFDCDNVQHNYHYGYDDSDLYSEEAHLVDKFGSREESAFQSGSIHSNHRGGAYPEGGGSLNVENVEHMKNLSAKMLQLSKDRKKPAEGLLPVTQVTKKSRRKAKNTNDEYDCDGVDVRDTSEFEYMMQEYMNVDEKNDLEARKLRRRKIRTMCGQIISTIKKKLNTIWWKTFWKQTMTIPGRRKEHRTTQWYRLLNQMKESSYPLDSLD